MSRWLWISLGFLLGSCATAGRTPYNDEGVVVSLDRAILNAAEIIKADLEEGTTIAVLDFNSGGGKLDEYVMEELEIALVSGKKLDVKEKKAIDQVRQQKLLQLQGDVSDDTAAAIGKEQGWTVIILGNLFDMKDTYRFRIRAVKVVEGIIATAYAVDLSIGDRKARNLLDGRKPPQLPLQTEAPAKDDAPLQSGLAKKGYIDMPLHVAWDEESIGGGFGGGFYFSPLPYVAVGMDVMDTAITFTGSNSDIMSFLPVHAGVLFPVTKRISAACYGTMHWLGVTDGKYEPLLHGETYKTASGDDSWGGVFITPGIKAGLLFDLSDGEGIGLSLMYKGYWFRDRYVNAVGLGVFADII
ncbi:MAG: hypothetical protein LBB61_03980 [Treponema sp.]|jgi:hypothetical protein|nr:hypothetical protein [Treponema sp.]